MVGFPSAFSIDSIFFDCSSTAALHGKSLNLQIRILTILTETACTACHFQKLKTLNPGCKQPKIRQDPSCELSCNRDTVTKAAVLPQLSDAFVPHAVVGAPELPPPTSALREARTANSCQAVLHIPSMASSYSHTDSY